MKTQQRVIRGTPDYLCCVNGMFIALELKRSAKEKMTGTLQELNINKIKAADGIAMFLFPENWETTKTFLRAITEEAYYEKFNRTNLGRG